MPSYGSISVEAYKLYFTPAYVIPDSLRVGKNGEELLNCNW